MRTARRHERRHDNLAKIREDERRAAHRRSALETSGEQLELRYTAQIERRNSEERGEQSSAERRIAPRDEPCDCGGRWRREKIAASGAEQTKHAGRADRREHWSAEGANQQVEHHARGARHRSEA